MEEINLKEMFDFFISKIYIIIIGVTVTTLLGIFYMCYLQVPMYKSETTILLVNEDKENLQADIITNQKLVTTYSEILKSRKVLSKVIKELDLDTTTTQLSNSITVTSVKDTEIIKVEVANKDPKQARDIANTLAKVFNQEIVKIYNLKNITIVDKAILAQEPYNISILKQTVLYLLVGFVMSSGIVFILFYFDTTVKSREQIEEKLGIPVLGRIPYMEVK